MLEVGRVTGAKSRLMKPLLLPLVDGENNAIAPEVAYAVQGDVVVALQRILAEHAPTVYLLPLSGVSSGGVLQAKKPADGVVVGVQFTATARPQIRRVDSDLAAVAAPIDITQVALDAIVIDAGKRQIYAGSAVTLAQLNQALAATLGGLGARYTVLGADLTSSTYAQVGATFMTGGMGPQRRYFSDSVTEIALFDGQRLVSVQGNALKGYAATYGWSGLVCAVRCEYVELPPNEVAFALPVDNSPRGLARLLQHLSPYTYLNQHNGRLRNQHDQPQLILGIEHITQAALRPLLASNAPEWIRRRGQQLRQKCVAAAADGVVFINAYSDLPEHDFLLQLLDAAEAEQPRIAGIALEHTEVFPVPDDMRALREAVPAAARRQQPNGRFVYKKHTDINIRLAPARVGPAMRALWQAHLDYVAAVQAYFDTTPGLRGEILIYGHLNPYGVDPHNRITFACDAESVYTAAQSFIQSRRKELCCTLQSLSQSFDCVFVGGEKGAASEQEMFEQLGGLEQAPKMLADKCRQQSVTVRAAARMFNWRAVWPYGGSS